MSAFAQAADAEDGDGDMIDGLRAQRDELLDALCITAQSLAWLHWGECRGFHDELEQPNDALSIARMAIEKATREAA